MRYLRRLLPGLGLSLCVLAFAAFHRPFSLTGQLRGFEHKAESELQRLYREDQLGEGRARVTRESKGTPWRMRLVESAAGTRVGLVVKLNGGSEAERQQAETALGQAGFKLRTRLGEMGVIEVRVADLPKLAALGSVQSLRPARYKHPSAVSFEPHTGPARAAASAINDAANAVVKAPEARAAYNLTGRGVVVGLVDSGIDWRHGDFIKDGKTRIKALWDLSDAAASGPGGVGRVYTETEINAALQASPSGQSRSAVSERDRNGHGSHVAGTAAGNGLGTSGATRPGAYAGIAPETDLVVVKATRRTDAQADFADDDVIAALDFIRAQAAVLNEPFVINLSFGGHFSAHDGTDPVEQAIDSLLAGGGGRQVVVAAGNQGDEPVHAAGVLAQGGEVVLPFTAGEQAAGLIAVYQPGDKISARVIKPDGTVIGPAALYNLLINDPAVELENSPGETPDQACAVVVTFKQSLPGTWKLALSGTLINNGHYDVWGVDDGQTRLDLAVADQGRTVSAPATARRAVSVGNFVSKTYYTNLNGEVRTRTRQGKVGEAASSSSLGPSRDGRLVPLIGAPGTYVASTRSADFTVEPATGAPISADNLTDDGGQHYLAFGTSMSAPVVTGTIALMLQADRTLAPDRIRRILTATAINDEATGAGISSKFGYGKLNAFEAVKAVINYTGTSEFVSVSGASFAAESVGARAAIMSGFGINLAPTTTHATALPLPDTLAGVSVRVTDSAGRAQLAPLFFVSPNQINYTIPTDAALGSARVEVLKVDGTTVAAGAVSISPVWPGLFSVTENGRGIGAANIVHVKGDGQQTVEPADQPINLATPGERVYLILYATGLRGRSGLGEVKLSLGGTPLTVEYAGPQSTFAGLDQINAVIPADLAGRNRMLELVLSVDGWPANVVRFQVQ